MTTATQQLRVRRAPKRAWYDRASIARVLDRGHVAHVAFVENGFPYCIPTLYARVGDELVIDGSSASRMVRALAAGAPACVTVTILDEFVLARSAFEHSANYDSAVLVGTFEQITDEEKLAVLEACVEGVLPGRWGEVRHPNRKELKATAVLAMPIANATVKTRTGPPDDDCSPDAELDVWAGVVPIGHGTHEPVGSPALRAGIPVATSVRGMTGSDAPPASCPAITTSPMPAHAR